MTYHSALQAVHILSFSARTFLGSEQRVKCFLEDDGEEGLLVSSCLEFLCSLDIEHPVGRVVQEACMAHHRAHGTGTTTMMALAGFWASEMETIMHQGIPRSAIIRYGDECLEQCFTALENLSLPCTQRGIAEENRTKTSRNAKLQARFLNSKHEESFDVDVQRICESLDNVCIYHSAPGQTRNLQDCHLGVTRGLAKHHPNYKCSMCQTVNPDHDSNCVCTAFSENKSHTDTLVSFLDVGNQFREVHLKTTEPSVLRLADSGCGVPEKEKTAPVNADDDISWFFDRNFDAPSPSSDLKQLERDREALFKTLDDRRVTNNFDPFPTEHIPLSSSLRHEMDVFVSSKTCENTASVSCFLREELENSEVTGKSITAESPLGEIQDDFCSCFSVEELDCDLEEVFTGQSTKNKICDEFGSCFPVEELDCFPDVSKKVTITNSAESKIDDDFYFCFSVQDPDSFHEVHKEDEKTKSAGDENDSDFDCCFLVEQQGRLSQLSKGDGAEKLRENKIDDILISDFHSEISENPGIEIGNDDKVNSQSDQRHINCFVGFHNNATTSTVQEGDSGPAKYNISGSTPIVNTNLSAIEESVNTLLQAKQAASVSGRLASIQNSSRHFRNVEQQGSDAELCHSLDSEVISIMKSTVEKTGLKTSTVASSRLANPDVDQEPVDLKRASSKTRYCDADTASQMFREEAIKGLTKLTKANTASGRLARVLNSSRHFQSESQVRGHRDAAGNGILTLGHDLVSGVHGESPSPVIATTSEKLPQIDSRQLSKNVHDCRQYRPHTSLETPDLYTCTKMTSSANLSPSAGRLETTGLTQLGLGLSHGSDLEMKLIIEAFEMQAHHRQHDENTQWDCDLNRLSVCTIAGPPQQESHLQAGLLVPVGSRYRSTIGKIRGKRLKALFVNGDATPTFSHPGYKNKVKVTTIRERPRVPSKARSWLEKVGKLLEELDIKLVILKGQADEPLDHLCLSKEVILLQNVPYKTLLSLGEACGSPLLTYLGDATADDAASAVTVSCWESGCMESSRARNRDAKNKLFAVIQVDGQLLQTAVLCHSVASLLPASETRFWTCAHRLQDCVRAGRYLPGAGLPEQSALKNLQRLSVSNSTSGNFEHLSCFKSSVVSAFMEGLVHFLIEVMKNMGWCVDLSQAKAHIMASLQKDQLEPVLSGWNLSELDQYSSCESDKIVLNTSAKICCNHFEPDLRQDYQSDVSSKDFVSTDYNSCERTSERDSGGKGQNTLCSRCASSNSDQDQDRIQGAFDRRGTVYDSYLTKKAAWENAWVLLKTVLQIDAHITTGVQDTRQSFHQCL